ncbi:MAG TPA: NACHT domain-containing protein [Myxococcaceae bacterium]|nr:NACHT domain-containing protein [Myxococcaceae bacterium]
MLLAFVRISRAQPDLSARLGEWMGGGRERARYVSGVEYIAASSGAAQPLWWRDDAVTLFFKGDTRRSAAERAFAVAQVLLERMQADLALPVRLAVHGAVVPWSPAGPVHPEIEWQARLAEMVPTNVIVLSEDVYLTLPRLEREQARLLGVERLRPQLPVYGFPSDAAHVDETSPVAKELALRESLRRYVNEPEIRQLRYVGFPVQKKQPPSLDVLDVFVAPDVYVRRAVGLLPEAATGAMELLRTGAPLDRGIQTLLTLPPFQGRTRLEPSAKSFAELFARHRALVVLGDPGSGKTTLMRWLAVVAAGGPLRLAEKTGLAERLLPLMVSVGRLAEVRRALGGAPSVEEALARYFEDRQAGRAAELGELLRRHLAGGACLVLLDGLDEVAGHERETVLRWLEELTARYPANRYVVSSRQVGYPGFSLQGRVEVVLGPFQEEQIRRYVTFFNRAYRSWETGSSDDAGADQASKRLLDALLSNPRLRGLAANPFLLSSLVVIHRAEGQLPRHRVQAYEVFARTLCETWGNVRRVVAGAEARRDIRYEEEAVPVLGELALEMHRRWPAGVAPEAFLIDTLSRVIEERDGVGQGEARTAAREFLQRSAQDVQLLLERGPGQWAFLHLTFQEFFAAVGLHSLERFQEVALEHLLDPRWEEVVRLGVGYMALVQKRAEKTRLFIEDVLRFRIEGKGRWLTDVLRKQVPLAALLAADAGDALRASTREQVAKALGDWIRVMPLEAVEPVARELALTDFREELVGLVARALEADDQRVQLKALYFLWRLEAVEQLDALRAAERATSPLMRLAAAGVLLALKQQPNVESLLELCHHRDVLVRLSALGMLAAVDRGKANDVARARCEARGVDAASPLLRKIAALVEGDEPELRAEGELGKVLDGLREEIGALARMGESLIELLKPWREKWSRREALADDDLMEMVASIAPLTRISLVATLAIVTMAASPDLRPGGTTPTVGLLYRMFQSESWKVRFAATVWAGAFLKQELQGPARPSGFRLSTDDQELLRQSLRSLLHDPVDLIRSWALFVMSDRPDFSLLENARSLLSASSPLVRTMARTAMVDLAPAEAIGELLRAIETGTVWWEQSAARSLLWRLAARSTLVE